MQPYKNSQESWVSLETGSNVIFPLCTSAVRPRTGEMGLICHKDKSFHLLPGCLLPGKLGFFFFSFLPFLFLPAETVPEASVALEHVFQKE